MFIHLGGNFELICTCVNIYKTWACRIYFIGVKCCPLKRAMDLLYALMLPRTIQLVKIVTTTQLLYPHVTSSHPELETTIICPPASNRRLSLPTNTDFPVLHSAKRRVSHFRLFNQPHVLHIFAQDTHTHRHIYVTHTAYNAWVFYVPIETQTGLRFVSLSTAALFLSTPDRK